MCFSWILLEIHRLYFRLFTCGLGQLKGYREGRVTYWKQPGFWRQIQGSQRQFPGQYGGPMRTQQLEPAALVPPHSEWDSGAGAV